MHRPAIARIHLDAIRHNARLARKLAPRSHLLAVVKGDAYGHGMAAVSQTLTPLADAFAVASLEEALQLRNAGIQHPLLLLEGFFSASELPLLQADGIHTMIHDFHQIQALQTLAAAPPVNAWIKLDTGMHRLGFGASEFAQAYRALKALEQVRIQGFMTHFARADQLEDNFTRQQLARFRACTQGLSGATSLANSPAVLAWPETHGDWIRPGMMLYGASPFDRPRPQAQGLKPAMTLESRIITVRELAAGECIGYGSHFRSPGPMRIGVVALGYADGFPRHAPNGLEVWVAGRLCPLAGRISMDMLTLDLSAHPEAGLGSRVVFWGPENPIEKVARACGTIAYELVSNLTARIPRHHEENFGDLSKGP